LLTYPEADLSLWRPVFCFQNLIWKISSLAKRAAWNMPKMDYFGNKFPKSSNARGSPSDPRLDSMNGECAKTLLPLNISGWCRCLAILEKNENLLFFYFLAPSLSINRFSTTEGLRGLIFIDAANKFTI